MSLSFIASGEKLILEYFASLVLHLDPKRLDGAGHGYGDPQGNGFNGLSGRSGFGDGEGEGDGIGGGSGFGDLSGDGDDGNGHGDGFYGEP